MIISSDTRLLIGINIEDLYDQPYIATWLHVFRDSYISELGVLDIKKKLNLARFFLRMHWPFDSMRTTQR